nr:molybdopterin-dependent oxidoreductase [bacterium]
MEFKSDIGKPYRYEEDGFEVVRTSMWSPPGCHPNGCGLKLYVKDGRLDHVEGDENNPITKGRLCPRCLALKDYVYNPSRVVYPMMRDPKDRGKHDAWKRCTWDEAYALIKEKVEFFKKEYGPESIAVFSGTGRSGGIMCQEMAQTVLGTPNACYTQSGFACYQPRSAACSHVLGAYYPEIDYAGGLEGTYDNPAWKCPEVIVVWGKMPLASNGDGLWGHSVLEIMKRGAKLITVDPRVTWLSTRSEIQLRCRVGTDAAMIMAWLWVIINEDLYDHDFVEKWTYGFEEFKARINDPVYGVTPEKAADICEVPVEKIYAAARMYANAKPATIAWGLAFDQNQNGNQAGHALLAMMAICDNVDVPGGQIIAEIPPMPGLEEHGTEMAEGNWEDGDAASVVNFGGAIDDGETDVDRFQLDEGWSGIGLELTRKAIGYDKYPLYCENIHMAHADCMLDTLLTDEPYKIHMGWIQSTNLL